MLFTVAAVSAVAFVLLSIPLLGDFGFAGISSTSDYTIDVERQPVLVPSETSPLPPSDPGPPVGVLFRIVTHDLDAGTLSVVLRVEFPNELVDRICVRAAGVVISQGQCGAEDLLSWYSEDPARAEERIQVTVDNVPGRGPDLQFGYGFAADLATGSSPIVFAAEFEVPVTFGSGPDRFPLDAYQYGTLVVRVTLPDELGALDGALGTATPPIALSVASGLGEDWRVRAHDNVDGEPMFRDYGIALQVDRATRRILATWLLALVPVLVSALGVGATAVANRSGPVWTTGGIGALLSVLTIRSLGVPDGINSVTLFDVVLTAELFFLLAVAAVIVLWRTETSSELEPVQHCTGSSKPEDCECRGG